MCICDHVAFSSTIKKWSKSSYLSFFYCIKICHLFIFLNFIFDSEEAQVYGVS